MDIDKKIKNLRVGRDVGRCLRVGRDCQHLPDHQKSKRVPEKYLLLLYWPCQGLWLCGS